MKIGIIDADLLDNGTRHPNLALMKISGYYKGIGHSVDLITDYKKILEYEQVYISKVFTFTEIPEGVTSLENVKFGGTGFFEDGGDPLPNEIEHHMPDYELYSEYVEKQLKSGKSRNSLSDYLDYSIGFATRGCFRKCEFCVNKKYDRVEEHSPIEEFLNDEKPYLYLWDDNFLAFPGWEKILDQIESTGKPFQFRQGLDVRLMTNKIAKRLVNTRYKGDFIFAFDHIEDRDLIEKKLKLWKRYCAKTTKLYVLCAYESQDEADVIRAFERIKILMKYGCLPYIMRYDEYKNSNLKSFYTQLARWCNQPQFFKKKSFRQFCETNQEYHKNPNSNCAAYQAMLDFEKEYPETASKYYDLRFEEENEYSTAFGYGRKYSHRQDCDVCLKEQKMWKEAYKGQYKQDELLTDYFTQEIDLQCLIYKNIKCQDIESNNIASWFCHKLLDVEIFEIVNLLKKTKLSNILPSNIPQYSQVECSIHRTVDILYESGLEMTFDDLGYHLAGKEKSEVAQKKYGENHSKLATLLDLTAITFSNNKSHIQLSILGNAYYELDKDKREALVARLIFRIPIIQHLFINALEKEVSVLEYMHGLANVTKNRRKSNVIDLIEFLEKYASKDLEIALTNIKED